MARHAMRWAGLVGVIAAVVVSVCAGPALAASPAVPDAAARVQTGEDWRCMLVNGQAGLNVRSGAGTAYGVLITLQPGATVDADMSRVQPADGYQWVPVQYSGGEGWAITTRLDPCPITPAPAPTLTLTPVPTSVIATEPSPTQTSINSDGVLDHNEISIVARSVVLIGALERSRIYATGTGTVTTPDGLIVTNAHVVENSDRVAIALLNDINDPPDFKYLGRVVRVDTDTDVALIAIDSDLNGKPVTAADLDLPYIPATLRADQVYRGDTVYIFGYPAIGDDYLVVTTGVIVSVENGVVNGQRLPVWYRTDAEIAPGNSGGLAVSGNGEFIGIPTFVQTESETGGRLGGIRPAEVALMAVLDESAVYGTASEAPSSPTTPPAEAVVVTFGSITLDHGTVIDGQTGLALHAAFTLTGWQGRDATIFARFFNDDAASTPLINANAPGQYRDKANQVLTSAPVLPCCAETFFPDLPLFIPYEALGLTEPGTYPLKIQIEVVSADEAWRHTLSWEFIVYSVG